MTRATSKAQRLAEIPELLKLRPRSSKELAVHYGIPQRTIQRYIADIRDMGIPIVQEGIYYRVQAQPNTLNAIEALAVHAAVRLLYHHSPSRNPYYRSALEKLALVLPELAKPIIVPPGLRAQLRVIVLLSSRKTHFRGSNAH